jgi:hypothetical protein
MSVSLADFLRRLIFSRIYMAVKRRGRRSSKCRLLSLRLWSQCLRHQELTNTPNSIVRDRPHQPLQRLGADDGGRSIMSL